MASIADLFGRLLLDATGFESDVVKVSSKAADKASTTMSGTLSSGLKTGLKVVAGAVATGLAVATTEGLKLNEVLNTLQAETGATGADWEAMQSVVRRENGRTTESIDEIAAATKSMRQDLGLTGEEIDKYADRIFDAGLVTHTSAAQITGAVDDIVDGFHVSVDQALGDIDKLSVSQQRFGGSLQDRLAVLPKLAGALNALNRTEDDGIALLNAAASAGLDATDVQLALTAAVSKFKIPKALKDIIGVQEEHGDKVQFAKDEVVKLEEELAKFVVPERLREIVHTLDGIADPTLRAAAAEKIYTEELAKISADPLQTILDTLEAIPDQQGRVTKAQELGLGKSSIAWATLAGQIATTKDGLDAYEVSTEDSVGAIERQADAIDSGPLRSLELLGQKIGAIFADAGSNPLVTGVASIGTILGGFAPNLTSKLGTGLVKGLGKIAGPFKKKLLAVVLAATLQAGIAGEALGDAIGGGMSTALVKGKGLQTALMSGPLGGAITKAGTLLGGRFGLAFKLAAVIGIAAIAQEVSGPINQAGKDVHDQLFANDGPLGAVGNALEGAGAWLDDLPWPLGPKGAPDWAYLGGQVRSGVEAMMRPIPEEVSAATELARNGIAQTPAVVSSVLIAGTGQVTGAAKTMVSGMDTAWTAAARKAGYGATRVGKAFYDGIIAKQSVVGQALEDLVTLQETTMDKATEIAYLTGVLTSQELADGLHDKRDNVRQQAEETRRVAEERLAALRPKAGNIGKDTNTALAKGMKDKDPNVRAQANRTRGIIEKSIVPRSNAPVTAAHNLGARAARALKAGFGTPILRANIVLGNSGYLGGARAEGGPVLAGVPYLVGERRPEVFVPQVSGHVYPTVQQGMDAVDAPGKGGNTYNVNLLDRFETRSARDIGSGLVMLEKMGYLPT